MNICVNCTHCRQVTMDGQEAINLFRCMRKVKEEQSTITGKLYITNHHDIMSCYAERAAEDIGYVEPKVWRKIFPLKPVLLRSRCGPEGKYFQEKQTTEE